LTSSPNDVTTTSGVGEARLTESEIAGFASEASAIVAPNGSVAPLVDATAAVLEGLVDDEVGAHDHLVAIPAL
jgi:hypothetical protein